MAALGNTRRGIRSPGLIIAALIACVILLGFNYWVSSSRNLELQTRLFEMEGEVRSASAERGDMIQQKMQIQEKLHSMSDHISYLENRHKSQLDSVLADWKQEKATLMLNVSFSARTIHELKAKLASLGVIEKELQDCQANQTNLRTALNGCDIQMADLRKECAAKTQKSPPVSPTQANSGPSLSQKDTAEKLSPDDTKQDAPQDENVLSTKKSDNPQQEILVGVAKHEGNGVTVVEKEDKPEDEHEPGDQQNAADSKPEKQTDLKGNAGSDPGVSRAPSDLKDQKPADYNGDNDNQGELEADKQAELAKKI